MQACLCKPPKNRPRCHATTATSATAPETRRSCTHTHTLKHARTHTIGHSHSQSSGRQARSLCAFFNRTPLTSYIYESQTQFTHTHTHTRDRHANKRTIKRHILYALISRLGSGLWLDSVEWVTHAGDDGNDDEIAAITQAAATRTAAVSFLGSRSFSRRTSIERSTWWIT